MSSQFGTSGVRGLVEDLLGGDAVRYVRAFARHLRETGVPAGATVFLGRDLRDSSPAIAGLSARALAAEGLTPLDCGAIPTPALASFSMAAGAPCLMVTGSHIPSDRNGIKFYLASGEIAKPDEAAISRLAAAMDPADPPALDALEDAGPAARAHWRDRHAGLFPATILSGLTIGLYAHSSVACDFLAEDLSRLGAAVVFLGRSETFVPVDTEAVDPDTAAQLRRWSQEHGLDAIVSTDADGDRPLMADERGALLRGDEIGLLTARRLGAGTIVTPVTSNSGIDADPAVAVLRTRVGSPYVIEAMARAARPPVVGFEANGGVLLGSDIVLDGTPLSALPTRDSFLPILTLLVSAREEKLALSELVAGLSLPVCRADRLQEVPTASSAALVSRLSQDDAYRTGFLSVLGTERAHDGTDGLRMTLKDGAVVHIRPSGNAPELRCYVEAATPAAADALLAASLARIGSFL